MGRIVSSRACRGQCDFRESRQGESSCLWLHFSLTFSCISMQVGSLYIVTRTKLARASFTVIFETTMFSNQDRTVQWDRVASELRACRESQRKAWGDIESTTLGRYLAGAASPREQAEVERALAALPDLRTLTDLVRDILNDLPEVPVEAPFSEPIRLPFRTGAVRLHRSRLALLLRPRSSVVAAACLLLIFGLAMPQPGFLSAPRTGEPPRLDGAVAMRAEISRPGLVADVEKRTGLAEANKSITRADPSRSLADTGHAGDDLPRSRPLDETRPASSVVQPPDLAAISPRKAAELNRMAFLYTANGELTRAIGPLHQVHWMCRERLGPNHPTTQKTVRYLANVYQAALNAPPVPPPTSSVVSNTVRDTLSTGAPSQTNPATASLPYTNVGSVYGVVPAAPTETLCRAAATLREHIAARPAREVQQEIVPVLAQAIESAPTAQERREMIKALAALGPAARTAVPVLADRLNKSKDPAEVKEVLLTLKEIGPAAREALPVLVALSARADSNGPRVTTHRIKMTARKIAPPSPTGANTGRNTTDTGPEIRQLVGCLQGLEGRCGIDDRAGCFSVQALRRSTRLIHALAQRKHVEVIFETVQSPGEGDEHPPKGGTEAALMREMGARAVHLVYSPKGNVFEVHVGEGLRRDGITAQKLRERLLERCRNKPYDRALDESIHLVEEVATNK
jgi:hypothetical protein